MGAAAPAGDFGRDCGDIGADDLDVHLRAEGIFPGAGYRSDSGNFGGAAIDFVSGNGGAAEGAGADYFEGPGCGEPFVVYRRGWDEHDAEQRANSDQFEIAGRAEHERYGRDYQVAEAIAER